jgi:hypothetical protein
MTDTIMKASRVAAVSEVVRQTGDGAIYESHYVDGHCY